MKFYLFIAVAVMMLTSCSSRYKLFQEDREDVTDSYSESRSPGFLQNIFPNEETKVTPERSFEDGYPLNFSYQSKILPGDTLQIDVYNRSRRISLDTMHQMTTQPSEAPTVQAKQEYLVESDGTLYLPILHSVTMQGLTEQQATQMLTDKYRPYLTEPFIKVRITNKRVYVLGETGKGVIPISGDSISLYEVIAKSGGLTDGAKRDAIQIISGPLGNQKARIIDMTKLSALNAADLMIPANSIVYVQPRYMRSVGIAVSDFSTILGVITNTLSSYITIDYIVNGRN